MPRALRRHYGRLYGTRIAQIVGEALELVHDVLGACLRVLPRAGLAIDVHDVGIRTEAQLGAARAVGRRLVQRMPAPPVAALLHSALALLLDDVQGQRYQPHTLVDQAVDAAKAARGTRMQAGFLNACLRRFLREREALCAGLDADPVALWNHPLWWVERVRRDHPDHWEALLEANNRPGPMARGRRTSIAQRSAGQRH